jgi:hypothetical protein
MSYGVIIVSQTQAQPVVRQTAIIDFGFDLGVHIYTRLTDGKQGRVNVWRKVESVDFDNNEQLIGNPVAVPVSPKDQKLFSETGFANVLLQKLVRQHSVLSQELSDTNVEDLFWVVANKAQRDELAEYHVDNRGRRSVITSATASEVVVTSASDPVITIERSAIPTAETAIGFVPSYESMKDYVPRTFVGDVTESQVFDFALANKLNIQIEGEAGTGKTSSAMHYASQRGMRFYSVSSNIALEPTQLFGSYVPDGKGGFVWVDGGVTDIVRNGGLLLINEINFLPARVATTLFSLLDYRRQITLMDKGNEVINAHPNLLIVSDYNPEYRGTSLMNEALKDRFEIKMRYEYDSSIESKILKSTSLLELANNMRSSARGVATANYGDSSIAFETPISTRILKTFELIAKGLSYEFACYNFVNNFASEERPAVKMLLEGLDFNLRSDLGIEVEHISTEHETV